jgi:hypothetical protein
MSIQQQYKLNNENLKSYFISLFQKYIKITYNLLFLDFSIIEFKNRFRI